MRIHNTNSESLSGFILKAHTEFRSPASLICSYLMLRDSLSHIDVRNVRDIVSLPTVKRPELSPRWSQQTRLDRGRTPVKLPSSPRGVNMTLSRLERLQVWIFKAITGVIFAVFQLFSPAVSGEKLPPVRNPLLLIPATQLAKKIRRKEVCTRSNGELTAAERTGFNSMNY